MYKDNIIADKNGVPDLTELNKEIDASYFAWNTHTPRHLNL